MKPSTPFFAIGLAGQSQYPWGQMSKLPDTSQDFFEEGTLVGVLTTQPLDRVLDYKAPEGGCWLGAFVEVPLGPRKVLGVVWGPNGTSTNAPSQHPPSGAL